MFFFDPQPINFTKFSIDDIIKFIMITLINVIKKIQYQLVWYFYYYKCSVIAWCAPVAGCRWHPELIAYTFSLYFLKYASWKLYIICLKNCWYYFSGCIHFCLYFLNWLFWDCAVYHSAFRCALCRAYRDEEWKYVTGVTRNVCSCWPGSEPFTRVGHVSMNSVRIRADIFA